MLFTHLAKLFLSVVLPNFDFDFSHGRKAPPLPSGNSDLSKCNLLISAIVLCQTQEFTIKASSAAPQGVSEIIDPLRDPPLVTALSSVWVCKAVSLAERGFL